MTQRHKTGKSERQQLLLYRSVTVPDRIKVARYEKVPELGPRILFFSGGTALKHKFWATCSCVVATVNTMLGDLLAMKNA